MADLRRIALLLAGLALLAAASARADEVEILIESTPPPVELLAPRAGSVLPGGGVAVLAWRPRAALDLEALGFVEWEAFLSLDGGVRYPVRLTPHLDLDRRWFSFQVPALSAEDVRLMLRFGDEVTERGYLLPGRFRIAPAAPAGASAVALPALGRGEAARPGEPGVVAWTEGSRSGGGLRLRTALPVPPAAVPLRWAAFLDRPMALAPPDPPGAEPPGAAFFAIASTGRPASRDEAAAGLPAVDLLLQSSRRNE